MSRRLALLAAPLVLAFGAAALGSLALFAAALGLVLVYAGAAVTLLIAARRLHVTRTVDRHEVLEGQPVTIAFRATGLRGLPAHVEVRAADGTWAPFAAGIGTTAFTIERPGAHVLEASALRLRDDLGLFSRPMRGGEPEALLVLPAPEPVGARGRRGGADPVGDPDPDGLRQYVPGTPMSRIHWAASARGGELQERHFAISRDHLPLVVVETAGAPDGAVDWAARAAAGHVLALARAGGCRVLLPGDRIPTTIVDPIGQWPAVHRRLAALDAAAPHVRREAAADRDTLYVRAAGAPADAARGRRALPPGVVPLARWTAATA